jgi:DNA end-binding protein Ku
MHSGKGADRSYALLREAIRESQKVGIAKIILRDSQHLAAVEVIGDALVLTMMRFADELADLDDFRFPSSEGIRQAELRMGRQLVENLTAKWQPEKYTDEYVENLMRLIQAKLKGRKPKLVERETARGAEVVDLMERLRASLEGKGEGRRRKEEVRTKGEVRTKEEVRKKKEEAGRGRAAATGRPKKAKSAGRRRVA